MCFMHLDAEHFHRSLIEAEAALDRFKPKVEAGEVKQAKPTSQEFDRLGEFLQDLESNVSDSAMQDADFRDWVRNRMRAVSGSFNRVLWGGRTAIEHACDPASDTLEWKPEIAAAMAAAQNGCGK